MMALARPNARSLPRRTAVGLVFVLLAAGGCFNPWKPLVAGRGTPTRQPTPNSPQGIVELFEWCYNQRDASVYREIFSDDYRFIFDAADSAGNAYRDTPWTREIELESTTRLFQEATEITLRFDNNMIARHDYREEADSTDFYKSIRTNVVLTVRTSDGSATNVQGQVDFYLVRGDVALIPQEMWEKGFRPDRNRWYIRRWEDRTAGSSGAPLAALRPGFASASRGATPLYTPITWGGIKTLFVVPPGPAAGLRASR